MGKKILLLLLLALGLISPAHAQSVVNPCTLTTSTPAYNCAPVTITAPLPVTISPSAAGGGVSGYPFGATPAVGANAGTTGAISASIAAKASQFSYICGFVVTSNATGSTSGPVTVSNLTGSNSFIFQMNTNVTGTTAVVSQTFNPCIPGDAVNTAITVTTAANADGTGVDVSVWGYQQ
jgi:hypothetical protein